MDKTPPLGAKSPPLGIVDIHSDHIKVELSLIMIRILVQTKPWPILDSTVVDLHYTDVIMSTVASQITGVSIAYSNVGSGADQRKHQSSASLAFVRGIHR